MCDIGVTAFFVLSLHLAAVNFSHCGGKGAQLERFFAVVLGLFLCCTSSPATGQVEPSGLYIPLPLVP